MLSPMVLKKREKLHVRHTGVAYRKPLGRVNDPMVIMGYKRQREVTISRLLIESIHGERLPDLRIAINTLNQLKREADYNTKEMLRLNYNNFGNYLLEVPEDDQRNVRVVEKFLDWVEGHTEACKRPAVADKLQE